MIRYLRFADLKAAGIVNNWPSLKRQIKNLGFPPGQLIGANTRAWDETAVQSWLAARPAGPKPVPKSPGRRRKIPKSISPVP